MVEGLCDTHSINVDDPSFLAGLQFDEEVDFAHPFQEVLPTLELVKELVCVLGRFDSQ